MNILRQLMSNRIFMISAASWFAAQLLKTLIDIHYSKGFNAERLWGSGGMPSSHSATVCALTSTCVYRFGLSSFEFAISAILAIIVMYDAMGVRRETGKQAKVLNLIKESMVVKEDGKTFDFDEKLKEFVGHTPLQVLMGAILGIFISVLMNRFM